MNYTGYIEGYYGKLLTWDARKRLIDTLAQNGLTHYLFGNKEDAYHRLRWFDLPNKEYTDSLTDFIAYGAAKGVTIIPAIAPGLTFDNSDTQRTTLTQRLTHFKQCGAQECALFMDDIPAVQPTFTQKSLGVLHGELVAELTQKSAMTLHFCPTVYTDEIIDATPTTQTYLTDLASALPESTLVFWTGEATIAETLNEDSLQTIAEYFSHRFIIWDNFYSNDYATTRLFIGNYTGRDREYLTQQSAGIMINPTGMIETDSLLLSLFSNWTKGSPQSYDMLLTPFNLPQALLPFLGWIDSPFSENTFTKKMQETKPMEFFTKAIVLWDSSLKREWYPYLHRIFVELRMIEKKTTHKPFWYEQRFLPYTANKLKS